MSFRYDVDVVLFNPGDHPGETPLCYGQAANYDLMRNQVIGRFGQGSNPVVQHFEAYERKFVQAFPKMPALKVLDSPGLYRNFDKIILDRKPKTFYVNSDWKTRLYFAVLNVIPRSWSDKARLALMRLPK